MKKNLLLLLLAWFSIGGMSLAQVPGSTPTPNDVQHCVTMAADSALRARYPGLGTLQDWERDIQRKITEIKLRQASGRTTAEVITIPIVVHVVHNGEAVGQGTNISAAQVQSQIDVLNEDFRRKAGTRGANNNPLGADVEIEFCLTSVDPTGKTLTEKGIHRYNGQKATWSTEEVDNVLKPSTYWDPDKYYNVWVVNFTGTVPGGTLLGYAQFPIQSGLDGLPASGSAATDGVVILYKAFGSSDKGNFPVLGSSFSKGRTLTHETGHYLGLRHIWGDGKCADDFVGDTPSADGPTSGCPTGRVSCGHTNMIENYMDYTDDVCMNIFTQDQKERMRAVLEISPRRKTLPASDVCGNLVAAKPKANFGVNKQKVLRGGSVTFNDLSTNFPNAWKWTFEGGEPSVSSERNPTVKYSNAGEYKVTLIASNAKGADTLSREAYIEVSTEGLCSTLSNFGNGTPTLLKAPKDSVATGYIAGNNNLKHQAKAEYFSNDLGYVNLGGASIRFGVAKSSDPNAVVKVTAWNARGFQGSPGAVLETKLVPVKTIQQDIANNVPTRITFDRNVPLFSRGFYVGVELTYAAGDTVALITTKDGESTAGTAWEKDQAGVWKSYTISRGENVAHAIFASVGMNPSVHISSTAIFINAGENVTLNAKGASIFSWGPDNAGLNTTIGPQVIAHPTQTTMYTVSGSGLGLCDSTATFTIFVSGTATGTEPPLKESDLLVAPNPSPGQFKLSMSNSLLGAVDIQVFSVLGNRLLDLKDVKNAIDYEKNLDLSHLAGGTYIVSFSVNHTAVRKRVVKL